MVSFPPWVRRGPKPTKPSRMCKRSPQRKRCCCTSCGENCLRHYQHHYNTKYKKFWLIYCLRNVDARSHGGPRRRAACQRLESAGGSHQRFRRHRPHGRVLSSWVSIFLWKWGGPHIEGLCSCLKHNNPQMQDRAQRPPPSGRWPVPDDRRGRWSFIHRVLRSVEIRGPASDLGVFMKHGPPSNLRIGLIG